MPAIKSAKISKQYLKKPYRKLLQRLKMIALLITSTWTTSARTTTGTLRTSLKFFSTSIILLELRKNFFASSNCGSRKKTI